MAKSFCGARQRAKQCLLFHREMILSMIEFHFICHSGKIFFTTTHRRRLKKFLRDDN